MADVTTTNDSKGTQIGGTSIADSQTDGNVVAANDSNGAQTGETSIIDGKVEGNTPRGKITVIVKDPKGTEIGQFIAEDGKNIAELAAMHGIDIPVSCGGGVCGVCMCKVEDGKSVVKSDAFNSPLIPLKTNEAGEPEEVLTCIAGFNPEKFNDGQDHTVILQRTY